MSGVVLNFPFFPLARKRQIEAALAKPGLELTEIYRLRALLGWCENMPLQERLRRGASAHSS